MKQWNAYIILNGEDCSVFDRYAFDVSDELYDGIQTAITNGKKLSECDFYDELKELAENGFYTMSAQNYEPDDSDKPCVDDYDEDELDQYEADLEEWEEWNNPESQWDDYCLIDVIVEDPGDERRFKDTFIGKKTSLEKGKHIVAYEFIDEYCASYRATLIVNDEGIIEEITNIEGAGLESESVRSSSFGDCYPDYYGLAEEIKVVLI